MVYRRVDTEEIMAVGGCLALLTSQQTGKLTRSNAATQLASPLCVQSRVLVRRTTLSTQCPSLLRFTDTPRRKFSVTS